MPAPPPISGLLEAALYAEDLDAARDFYHRLLGMEVVAHVEGRHIFFRAGLTVLLVFNPRETTKPSQNPDLPVPSHGTTGSGHVCLCASRKDIALWRNHLTQKHVLIEAEFDWPNGARSLYLRDPAGNSVEFAEPRLWS
ncbi:MULTISPECIES: VOC family protein [unclassified Marinovum]